jgi:hypothetical protein
MLKNKLISIGLSSLLLFALGEAQVERVKPLDVLLVIDSSGSMAWIDRDPQGLRIQAAKLFVDLSNYGDRIGVYEFSTTAEVIFPLFEIRFETDKDRLKKEIERIESRGEFTDITQALQGALREMERAREKAMRAVVFLTDGEIDPDPSSEAFIPYNRDYEIELKKAVGDHSKIRAVKKKFKDIVAPISREILRNKVLPIYKSYKIPIITIAFGLGADKELLREIADFTSTEDVTRNFYEIISPAQLQTVLSDIFEQLKKERQKIGESTVSYEGRQEIIHKISVDDFTREVTFKFIFNREILPEEITIFLRDPEGNIIDRTTQREGVGHIFEKSYELYNIINPIPGTWEITIKGKSDVKLDITISTWGKTDLKIVPSTLKPEYSTGEAIFLKAYLENQQGRITSLDFLRDLSFFAEIRNPENKIDKIVFYDDGMHYDDSSRDGIYGNSYTSTTIPGDYIVKIKAQGKTTGMRPFNFSREVELQTRVVERKPAVIGKPVVPEPKAKPEKKPSLIQKGKTAFSNLKKILTILIIALGAIAIIIVLLKIIKGLKKPIESLEEIPLILSFKIKEGETEIIGSKQVKDSSVDEKNLIIRRQEGQYFISCGGGTLELNGSQVSGEMELKNGDILKLGDLYFEVALVPEKNNVILKETKEEYARLRINMEE